MKKINLIEKFKNMRSDVTAGTFSPLRNTKGCIYFYVFHFVNVNKKQCKY